MYLGTASVDNFYIRSLGGHDVFHLPAGAIDRTHLERAKRQLQHFEIVLILEELEQGMRQLKKILHWRAPGNHIESKSFGKGDTSIQFSEDQRQVMRESNALDVELYEYARDRSRAITAGLENAHFGAKPSRPKGCDKAYKLWSNREMEIKMGVEICRAKWGSKWRSKWWSKWRLK